MKIHIHDNNSAPGKQECKARHEVDEFNVLSLHFHDGSCQLCSEGHCHSGVIALVMFQGELYVTFEGVQIPNKITFSEYHPHRKPNQDHSVIKH